MAEFGSLVPPSWYDAGVMPTPPASGPFPAANSVDWLQQRLPKAMGDWLGNAYAEGTARAGDLSPRTVAGEAITGAMNLMPAGRMVAPRPGIRAYHGSPYDFDRFDLSKIGTGEGAQAYGHGLYFAENPKVAESYRPMVEAGSPAEGIGLKPGKMYEVNINAKPEQFLDWDRPIGQQPEIIDKLRSNPLTAKAAAFDRPTGAEFYENRLLLPDQARPAASAALRDAGIPGIRYKDQGSRVMDAPEHLAGRLEDIQNQMDPLIWASREGNHTPAQGAQYDRLFNERATIQDQIRKYKEANSTSNYVLFNDSIIDILKKWGLMGGMAGAGAADQGFGSLTPPAQHQ